MTPSYEETIKHYSIDQLYSALDLYEAIIAGESPVQSHLDRFNYRRNAIQEELKRRENK